MDLFDIFVASHSCPLVVGWFLIVPFCISNSIQTDSKKKNTANGLFLLYYLLKVKEIPLYIFIPFLLLKWKGNCHKMLVRKEG